MQNTCNRINPQAHCQLDFAYVRAVPEFRATESTPEHVAASVELCYVPSAVITDSHASIASRYHIHPNPNSNTRKLLRFGSPVSKEHAARGVARLLTRRCQTEQPAFIDME